MIKALILAVIFAVLFVAGIIVSVVFDAAEIGRASCRERV